MLRSARWTAFVALTFLCVWAIWAFDTATLHVAPGLLDDGAHIVRALRYTQEGFFTTVLSSLAGVLDPANRSRFYEVHYATLGLFAKAFGLDLRLWYLSQLLFCALTAAAGSFAVYCLTRSRLAALVCLVGILSVSPLPDAARANFGKVEVVMAMAGVFAFACVAAAMVLRWRPPTLGRIAAIALALGLALVFMIVASVAKESGKLLALVLPAFVALVLGGPWLAGVVERRWPVVARIASRVVEATPLRAETDVRALLTGAVASALILALSFYVFRERADNRYLADYFTLNLDPGYLLGGFRFYLQQGPDVLILLTAIIPIAVFGFVRGGRNWAALVAIAGAAAVYMLLLFTFRYRAAYYAYVPAVLAVVAFAIGVALAPRRYQVVLLVLFALTRLYTLPYIHFQAAAQRYVDFVNFNAMQTAADLGAPRVILLDTGEQSQAIQEWNLLRQPFFAGRLPPAFGGPPDFRAWSYQQRIREIGLDRTPRRDAAGYLTGALSPAGELTSEPDVGDLVAVRSGKMRFGAIAARGVMPIDMNEAGTLTTIDMRSLAPVARVGGDIAGIAPCRCGLGTFDLHWQFFRVISPPRFLILGREADGWMQQRASVRVRVASPGQRLNMRILVPGWLPRQYPATIRASLNGETVSELAIAGPGPHALSVPLDRQGDVQLDMDRCGDPKDAPANDRRAFCYWLAGAEELQ